MSATIVTATNGVPAQANPPRSGQVPPAIGMTANGVPLMIPANYTLRIYTTAASPTFTAHGVGGGVITVQSLTSGILVGLPYWNGTAEQTANGPLIVPWIDFDGRTFTDVSVSGSYPYAYLVTDPAAPMPS